MIAYCLGADHIPMVPKIVSVLSIDKSKFIHVSSQIIAELFKYVLLACEVWSLTMNGALLKLWNVARTY